MRHVLEAEEREDWFAVLGLAAGVAVDEQGLSRAYKAKCLAVHPDKNQAPDAEAAFKAVRRARWISCVRT